MKYTLSVLCFLSFIAFVPIDTVFRFYGAKHELVKYAHTQPRKNAGTHEGTLRCRRIQQIFSEMYRLHPEMFGLRRRAM